MRKIQRALSGILATILLFSFVPFCPQVQAAETIELPDTLTPEMAKAYAEKLQDYSDAYASIEALGEERYPVLCICYDEYGDLDDGNVSLEIWIYEDGDLNNVGSLECYSAANSNHLSFGITKVGDINYCFVEYHHHYYPFDSSEKRLYTISNGQLKEIIRLSGLYYISQGNPQEQEEWNSRLKEWLSPGSDMTEDLTDSFNSTSIEQFEGDIYYEIDKDISCFYCHLVSQDEGAKKAISSETYNTYDTQYFSNKIFDTRDSFIGMSLYEQSSRYDNLMIELQKKSWAPDYGVPDILQSLDEQALTDMSTAISIAVDPLENAPFESAALTNSAVMDVAFGALTKGQWGKLQSVEYNDYRLISGVSSSEINEKMERLIGRTVDFTPYLKDELPVCPVDVDIYEPFVYEEGLYYYSDVYFLEIPYESEIINVFDIGNDLFLVSAAIQEDDFGDVYFDGFVTAVFQQKDDHYQLLKLYPIDTQPSIEEVRRYAIKVNPESNFIIDYNGINDFQELSEYAGALEAALDSADTLNDAGNSAVTTYLEYVFQNFKSSVVKTEKNVITITPGEVEAAQTNALEAKETLQAILQERDITLDRKPSASARIDVVGLDLARPMQIRIGDDAVNALSSADALTINLNDNQHAVSIPSDNLKDLGSFSIQIEPLAENKYRISFLDKGGAMIDRLSSNVTFAVPASSEFSTVQVIYGGNSDNWGGQYDPQNRTISFQTPYTGDYSILENAIEIGDIDMLDPELQRAIQFMVSRGYLDLDENGNFSPGAVLNRYSLGQALVKIFFALDRDAAATFTDIDPSSAYYPYIASGQQAQIANGYSDNTYRGENAARRAHVILFCSRTLMNKKDYTAPADPTVYLNYVDNETITASYNEDDVKAIALAVREGLIDNGGVLRPQQEITKSEAAWMLYKLFMLLYEISPAVITVESTEEMIENPSVMDNNSSSGAALPIGIAAIACLGIAGAVYLTLKKKTRQE